MNTKSALILVSLAVLLAGCTQLTGSSTTTETTVGGVFTLTGEQSFLAFIENGAAVAREDVRESGDVLGGNFTMEVADTQSTQDGAVQAVKKLINVDDVGIIVGPDDTTYTSAAIPIAAQNEIPMISYAATAQSLDDIEDNDYFFRTMPSGAYDGRIMAKYLEQQGYENASILLGNSAYGEGVADAFTQAFEERGGTVIQSVTADTDSNSYTSEISTVTEDNPEAIVLLLDVGSGATTMLKDAYQQGALDEHAWVATDSLMSDTVPEQVGRTESGEYIVEGRVRGIAADSGTTDSPLYDAFQQRYVERFGEQNKDSPYVAHAYDATAIAALAVQHAGTATDGTAIRDSLRPVANPPGTEVTNVTRALELIKDGEEINYQGIGSNVTFDEMGNDASVTFSTYQFEGGNITRGETITLDE